MANTLQFMLIVVLFALHYASALRLQQLPKISPIGLTATTVSFLALSSPVLADTDPVVQALIVVKPTLDVLINTMSVLFLARTIMSWYPKTDIRKFPYNAIVWPTEPLMAPARELLPPAFGVDISSIFWLGLLSFVREILTGQQGILTLIEN